MDTPGPSYTVLRIKRKATEPPLASLVIQDSPEGRIKKKRTIIGNGNKGVFRLAETVPDTWQGEGEEGHVLRERIKGLLSKQPSRPSVISHFKEPTTADPSTALTPPSTSTPASTEEPVQAQDEISETKPVTSSKERTKSQSHPQVKYRVVPPSSPVSRGMMPPRVMTYAEEKVRNKVLNFVDAEAVSTAAGPSRRKMSEMSAQEEKDMAAFLPMLEEYLSLESPSKSSSSRVAARRHENGREEDRYVYDLYYRDIRSGTTTPLGLGAGDGVNIGALLGYSDSSPASSPSNSEPEDEADEDSNDEDYYRNDYPEDEDADEDMHGYRDAFDEEEDDEPEERSEGERGAWDYR